MTRTARVAYAAAAAALPAIAFLTQPQACFRYLYVPSILGWLLLLCASVAGVQSLSRVSSILKLVTAITFGVAIQSAVLIPCVSELEESPRIVLLAHVVLVLGWLASLSIGVSVVGLLRGRREVHRWVMACGLALAAISLALGATRQYVGITGVPIALPELIIESPFPSVLQGGIVITLIALGVTMLQRLRERSARVE
jgi:uncharacterized membrane protein YozB (DUF420 family)